MNQTTLIDVVQCIKKWFFSEHLLIHLTFCWINQFSRKENLLFFFAFHHSKSKEQHYLIFNILKNFNWKHLVFVSLHFTLYSNLIHICLSSSLLTQPKSISIRAQSYLLFNSIFYHWLISHEHNNHWGSSATNMHIYFSCWCWFN